MRNQVAKVRLVEGQEPTETMLLKTYNTAMSSAAAELIALWSNGYLPPSPDGQLEVAKAVTVDGTVVGFNVYLVWGEPKTLGKKMAEEPA